MSPSRARRLTWPRNRAGTTGGINDLGERAPLSWSASGRKFQRRELSTTTRRRFCSFDRFNSKKHIDKIENLYLERNLCKKSIFLFKHHSYLILFQHSKSSLSFSLSLEYYFNVTRIKFYINTYKYIHTHTHTNTCMC